MQKKPLFKQFIILVVVALVCIALTVALVLWAGSSDHTLLDWKNLNWDNMIPVILICGSLCCVIIGIIVLFMARNIFHHAKDYLYEINKNGGKEK